MVIGDVVVRAPWELTPEMVLSEAEALALLERLASAENAGTPAERASAAMDRVIIAALLGSGLRCSEFCLLKVKDAVLAGEAPRLIVRSGEGRTVFIDRALARRMKDYVEKARPGILDSTAAARTDALILNERGKPYDRTALYRRVVRVLTAAGFGDRASVQLLRHTYGYLAYVRTGGNLLFVQRQLGHAHPGITAVYARLVREDDSVLAELAASPRNNPGTPARSNQPGGRLKPAQRPNARSARRNR